jgi:hypothetical protein
VVAAMIVVTTKLLFDSEQTASDYLTEVDAQDFGEVAREVYREGR